MIYLLLNACYCSATTELLATVRRPALNEYSRFYPHADRNKEENLIVRREVAVDSVHRLVDSLDSGAQANAEKILSLDLLVR